MKKVLIALDYDQTAQKVAEVGFKLAKSLNAEVVLLHVISNPVFYYSSYMVMAPLHIKGVHELKAVSQDFLDKTKHDLGDETIQTLVKEGDIVESIMETAKDLNVDIIVLGTHSRKWLEDILVGSVAESVLKQTTLPLFVIPTKKQEQ